MHRRGSTGAPSAARPALFVPCQSITSLTDASMHSWKGTGGSRGRQRMLLWECCNLIAATFCRYCCHRMGFSSLKTLMSLTLARNAELPSRPSQPASCNDVDLSKSRIRCSMYGVRCRFGFSNSESNMPLQTQYRGGSDTRLWTRPTFCRSTSHSRRSACSLTCEALRSTASSCRCVSTACLSSSVVALFWHTSASLRRISSRCRSRILESRAISASCCCTSSHCSAASARSWVAASSSASHAWRKTSSRDAARAVGRPYGHTERILLARAFKPAVTAGAPCRTS
mmetsp:Transcript_58205/g.153278  ORF Transcript_58205/g.153278 Transcript_58205/m.153278 type:complete len:285 (-) Transcript_58205:963-1817(-)